MATTYSTAPTEATAMLADLIKTKFDELAVSGAVVELLFAVGGDGKPAVKRFGHPAPGKVEKIDAKARQSNDADVRLVVDADSWLSPSTRKREAILHGLLSSLELARDKKTGEIKRDDNDRPLFKAKPGDWLATGFESTLREYGSDSYEHRGFANLREIVRQLHFDWCDDQATADDLPSGRLKAELNTAFAKQEAGSSEPPFDDAGEQTEPDEPDET